MVIRIKVFIIILLLCSAGGHAMAQVRQFDISAQNNSIIRSVGNGYALIYTEKADTSAWFLLYHDGQASAAAFSIPQGLQVRDVRVHGNQEAYFCGTYNGGDFAVVGMFSVIDVFFAGSPVYYALIDWTTDDNIKPTDLSRLDLFTTPTDSVCMAMVGDADLYRPSPIRTTTVVSARYSTSGWNVCSMVRKPSETRFTDIACLDNLIVAAASDTNGQGCFVKAFRPSFDFPFHPFTPMRLYGVVYGHPVGDVLIAQLHGDTAILAHYDTSASAVSTVFHRVAFNTVSGHHSVPTDTWVAKPLSMQPYGSNWTMIALLSDGSNNSLLQHAHYPFPPTAPVKDWMLRFSLPAAASTTATAWTPLLAKQHSMDWDASTLQARTSGNAARLTTYGTSWNLACSPRNELALRYTTAAKSVEAISEYAKGNYLANHLFTPVINAVSVSVICE